MQLFLQPPYQVWTYPPIGLLADVLPDLRGPMPTHRIYNWAEVLRLSSIHDLVFSYLASS
eukprot:1061659-Amphidinium_carterae.1